MHGRAAASSWVGIGAAIAHAFVACQRLKSLAAVSNELRGALDHVCGRIQPPAPLLTPLSPLFPPTALTGQTAPIVVNVVMTGAQIKDDLKALGWEGFTADADQQVGQQQQQVAAASACSPDGVTQKGGFIST